ncbi:aminotransferase class V-fold PLP-dependent enzyme [Massilia glaciei]|uniref:cysteine desulfurase n=1 Tax=Massilia glaciei TaxID=1524097 RepID=A0A2U2HJ86_9BURK|nr:aminotransferase class V-fold PLP-dependent enzyme [Massilia glaciei]PWF47617.1 aminotransferase class V-fold PLP-dependent enzyme [Massilia glaciei]
MQAEIYLDANATSAALPAALAAAAAALSDCYGNPSSTHGAGIRARAMLDAVRARARRVLGAGAGQVVFNSGATEGIQTAVLSALWALRSRQAAGEAAGSLLVYGATEHKAVPESLAHWNALLGTGLELRALPVDENGLHRLDVLRDLAPRAALVCTMAANNETGVVSDLAGIEAVLRDCAGGALWMVDSVQALGKLPLALAATRIDYAPFSGHKLYAPKGVGMLYVREGAPFTPLMAGGGQEAGLRAGTENMSGIAALGAVLGAIEQGGVLRGHDELARYREQLADALRAALPGIVFNAPFEGTLPTTLNFSVPGFASKELLDLFDAAGVRISSGSACSSAKAAPSYVLEAMALPAWRSSAALRMSFGPAADAAFIDAACMRIAHCGQALRAGHLLALEAGDGVLQLWSEGACSWLLLDRASRAGIVIDPLPELAARIAALLRSQNFGVAAVLATGASPGVAAGRAALLEELTEAGVPHRCAGSDAMGWPACHDQVLLGDGASAGALTHGTQVLARLRDGHANSYLLGRAKAGSMAADAARFVFCGADRESVRRLAALAGPETIVCRAVDPFNEVCSTMHADLQSLEKRQAAAGIDAEIDLDPGALSDFFATHPDALLVDVREPCERAVDMAPAWEGRDVLGVPLSRLSEQLAHWLRGEQRPIVFFCRSGNRSVRAARCLHRLGYRNAWHLAGGLALAA